LSLDSEQVADGDLAQEEVLDLDFLAVSEDLDGASEVALVLEEAALLGRVLHASFDPHHVFPPFDGVFDVLLEIVEKLYEGQFGPLVAAVVVKSRPEQVWIQFYCAFVQNTRVLQLLVDAGKAFFCVKRRLHPKMRSFSIPKLELVVVLSDEMGADFVVHHAHDPALRVLDRQANVDFAFLPVLPVGNARRSDLCRLKKRILRPKR